MKKAILIALFLISFTAVGAYFKLSIVPYVVFSIVCIITILITTDKIKSSEYPVYIFGMSLALLWQTSMLGTYVIGADIHGELFVANRVIEQGWDWSYSNVNNVSAVFGVISPALAKIGISPIWQFKLFYPTVFALVPLILYFAYKKMIGEKRAYFASLFFMIIPVFFIEVAGIVKSMVAEVFLALMVFFMAANTKNWQKAVGIGISALLATFCHYTIGTLAVLYLVGSFSILLMNKYVHFKWLQNRRTSLLHSGLVLLCIMALGITWLNTAGDGTIWNTYKKIASNLGGVVTAVINSPETTETIISPNKLELPEEFELTINKPTSNSTNIIETPKVITNELETMFDESPIFSSPDFVSPKETETNIDTGTKNKASLFTTYREPLMSTAMGLDFFKVSTSGKLFRITQYATQVLIILGFVYLILRYRYYNLTGEFASCVVVSYGLLAACLFLPTFSSIINASRFYHVSLFFLAPIFVIGLEQATRDIEMLYRKIRSSYDERH